MARGRVSDFDDDQPRLVQSKGDLTTLQSFGLRRGAKVSCRNRNCSDEAAFTARTGQVERSVARNSGQRAVLAYRQTGCLTGSKRRSLATA